MSSLDRCYITRIHLKIRNLNKKRLTKLMEAKKKKKENQLQKYVTNIINFTLHFLAVQIGRENVQSNNSTSKEKIQEKKNDDKLSILHL